MAKYEQTLFTRHDPGKAWIGEALDVDHQVPGGGILDPDQFLATDAVVVTVGAAGALEDATQVPVDELTGAIPNGTVLHFASKKFAVLTQAAAAGDTHIHVEALPTALVDNDAATYAGVGLKTVPSGTLVGRQRLAEVPEETFGPADVLNDDEIYLTLFEVTDADGNSPFAYPSTPEVAFYRHGCVVLEDFLPGWADMSAGDKAWIRAHYLCRKGVD